MSTDAVQKLEAALHDQPVNPLRPAQREEFEEERDRVAKFLNGPAWVEGNRAEATRRLRQLDGMLREQAPHKIEEPIRANTVHQLAKEVLESEIKPRMLSRALMRRAPADAVDHFLQHENGKDYKRALKAWRRGMWALDPDGPRGHTVVEKYRPEGGLGPGGAATYVPEGLIPGNFAMTAQAKEHWPLGEPTADTALKQATRVSPEGRVRQQAAAAAGRATQKQKAVRENWTPEQRAAWGEKMRLARAKKKVVSGEV
jgi:hypothetical protein